MSGGLIRARLFHLRPGFPIIRPGHAILAYLILTTALTAGCFELDLTLGSAEAGICQNVPLDPVGVDRDRCVQDAAIRKSDAELCTDIERPPPESKCYMLIAKKEMDPAACEEMKDNPGPTGPSSRHHHPPLPEAGPVGAVS